MSGGVVLRCVVALLAGLVVAACGSQGGGGGDVGGGDGGSANGNSVATDGHGTTSNGGDGGTTPHGPAFNIRPPRNGFGVDALGDTSTQTVIVRNASKEAQHIDGVTIAGANAGDFQITANSCTDTTIESGQSCTVQVKFAPVAKGTRTAEVKVTAKDAEPATATVQGAVGAGGTSTGSGGSSTGSGGSSTGSGGSSTGSGGP